MKIEMPNIGFTGLAGGAFDPSFAGCSYIDKRAFGEDWVHNETTQGESKNGNDGDFFQHLSLLSEHFVGVFLSHFSQLFRERSSCKFTWDCLERF
jgi:hypothetical protein